MSKKLIMSILLALTAALLSCAEAPTEPKTGVVPEVESTAFFSVQGKDIIAPSGEKFIIKGIGLGNWLLPEGYMFKFRTASSPRLIEETVAQLIGPEDALEFWESFRENYVTAEDVEYLKAIGMNTIRVPINYRILSPEAFPNTWLQEGFQTLDQIIDLCRQEEMYVIIDLHGAPGGQTGENIDDGYGFPWLFESQASQDRLIAVWKKIAGRYRNDPTVLAYELLNEPIPHFEEYNYLNERLEPLYKKVTEEIRRIDTNHIIMLGGAQWNSNFDVFGEPFDSKLVYAFHKYWTAPTVDVIEPYLAFRDRHNVPIFMSESGENTNEWIAAFRSMLEENEIGWCFWPYKKLDATSCIVSVTPPGEWASIVAFADRPGRTYEEIRKARPPIESNRATLSALLENVKFENTRVNPEYIEALGLKPVPMPEKTQPEAPAAE